MLTVVLQTDAETAKRHCRQFVPDAKVKAAGKYVAIQAPSLEAFGKQGIEDIAHAKRLPLVEVRDDVPAFS